MSKKRNILMLSLSGFLSVIALASCTPSDVHTEITTYTITVTSDEYGTITPSKTSAEAGEEITLTVNVNESTKKLDKIFVNDVAITSGEDGTYRFTMPSENVTIRGSYSDVTTPETYTITTESLEGVTITPSKTTGLVAGEEVSITVTVTDTTKEIATLTANEVTLGKGTDGTYKLVMPSENVTLKATLKDVEVEATYTITATSVTGATVTIDKETAKVGEEVSVTVTVTDETKEVATVTANEVTLGKGTDGTYKLTMPAENVTVTVTLKDIVVEVEETYDLTLPTATEDYSVTASKTTGILAGETLQITVNLLNSSKMIESLMLNKLPLHYDASLLTQTVSFIMPSEDSTISLSLVDDPSKIIYTLNIVDAENLTTNGFTAQYEDATGAVITGAKVGEEITFRLINNQTEEEIRQLNFARLYVGEPSGTNYSNLEVEDFREVYNSETGLNDLTYTFTMPANNIHMNVYTEPKTYEIDYTDDNEVPYLNATTEAEPGETVRVRPGALSGTMVTGIEVTQGITDIEVTDEGEGVYSFIMPTGNVRVTTLFENVGQPVTVTTSEHVIMSSASYYDGSTTHQLDTTISEGQSGVYLVTASAGGRLNLDFEVTDPEFTIASVVAVDTVTSEELYNDDSNSASISTTGNPIAITVTETSKYIDFTPEVYVVGDDGTETLLSEGFNLQIGTLDDSVDPTTIVNNKIARGYERFGYTFETTDETMLANGEFYQVEKIVINDTEKLVSSLYEYDGYPYLWLDTADYDSDTYTVKIVVSKGQYVFEENAEFLGSYVGNGLTEYFEYYDTYIKSSDLTINRDGTYTYGLEVSDWYASYDSISVDSTIAFDGTESYLTDATEGYDIYYKDGWAFVKGATLDKSALLKKGARSASTSTFDTALSTDETKVLLKQSIDSTTYYTYIDLTTNTIYPELTLEGKAFSTGSVAIFKDKEGTTILSVAFSASDEFETVTLDEYAGTYTKAETSQDDFGSIILNGAGGATINGKAYSYVAGGNNLITFESDGISGLDYKLALTLDPVSKTYTGTNASEPTYPESRTNYVGETLINNASYQLKVTLDSDETMKVYVAPISEDGTVGAEIDLTSTWVDVLCDLTNNGYLTVAKSELTNINNGTLLMSLVGDTLTIIELNIELDGTTYTCSNVTLTKEVEA